MLFFDVFGLFLRVFDVSFCNNPDTRMLDKLLRSLWPNPPSRASPVSVIATESYLELAIHDAPAETHGGPHFTHSRLR